MQILTINEDTIIACIMDVKRKLFKENFITRDEEKYIINYIEKKVVNTAPIYIIYSTDMIVSDFFISNDEVITRSKNYNISTVRNTLCNLYNDIIVDLLMDDSLFEIPLLKYKKKKLLEGIKNQTRTLKLIK
jgi:hypothetical protein